MSTAGKGRPDGDQGYLPVAGPLSETNKAFHRAYDDLVAGTLARIGSAELPVIVVAGDAVHLLWNREDDSEQLRPDRYHDAKAFSHFPLGLYLALQANGDGPLQASTRQRLQQAIDQVSKAFDALVEAGLPPEIERINRAIVDHSRCFVNEIIGRGSVEGPHVRSYARSVAPLLLENTAFAARVELDNLHGRVMRWKERMPQVAWQSLYVLICSGHQQRYRETAKQYFQRLLHEQDESDARFENRVIYAESIHDIPAALDLLARHIIDQQASITFFDDATRLQKDLLADASTRHVKELLP